MFYYMPINAELVVDDRKTSTQN